MRSASLLATWSWKRVRMNLSTWLRLFQMTLDWINIVYFYIPAAALISYWIHLYYRGWWITSLHADPPSLALFRVIVVIAAGLVALAAHFGSYGKITFSLEQGDRAYLLLSPIARNNLMMTLWLEGFAPALLLAVVLFGMTEPIAVALALPARVWFIDLLLAAAITSTLRIPTALWLQQDESSWIGAVLQWLVKFATAIPFVLLILLTVAGHWRFGSTGLIALALTWVMVYFVAGLRLAWDPLFTFRLNRIWGRYAPDDAAKVLYRRRGLSQFIARWLERAVGRPLHPVTWLVILRSLRQRGVLRVWWMITAAAVAGLRMPPSPLLKIICLAFFTFLFYQWWRMVIRPLYEPLIAEQSWIDPWVLRVSAQNTQFTLLAAHIALWIALALAIPNVIGFVR